MQIGFRVIRLPAPPVPPLPAPPVPPPAPIEAPILDKELAYGHQVPADRGHILRSDGRLHDSDNKRIYENKENRYGKEWLDKKIQLKQHLNRDPYYYLARQVAGCTGRTADDLIEDPLQHARPTVKRLKPVVTPPIVAAVATVPVVEEEDEIEEEEDDEESAMGSPDKISQPLIGANIAELRTYASTATNIRWAQLPEHIGMIFFKENLQAAVDWTLYEIFAKCGQQDVTLLDLITSPMVQTAFFRLVATTMRINELQTPRRNDNPKVMLPILRAQRLELLLQFRKLIYMGEELIFSDMPRLATPQRSVPPPPAMRAAYNPITERMDRPRLRTARDDEEYDKNKEAFLV